MTDTTTTEAWQECRQRCATPNEKHKAIEAMSGVFTADATFWMGGPDSPPMQSTATSVNEMILGGRLLQRKYSSDFDGCPFEGIGYFGFDNATGKYVGTWSDTMCTGIMIHTGEPMGKENVIETRGEFTDPMGQVVKNRHVTTIIDNDHHTFEMFHTMPGAPECKCGEIRYTRQS